MTRTRLLTAVLSNLLAVTGVTEALPADEVVLKDGRVIVGKTRKIGTNLEITTLDGVERVPQSAVDWRRTRNDEDLRDALEKLVNA